MPLKFHKIWVKYLFRVMSKPIYENIPKLTIQQLKGRLNGKPYIHFVWEEKSYTVHVAYSACRFGGTRPWFICPHCQSRVGSLLFFNHQIGCRHCLNTCYASENKSPMDRQHQKEQKALAKLGVDSYSELIWFDVLRKPKGMHLSTFEKRKQQLTSIHFQSARLMTEFNDRLLAIEQRTRNKNLKHGKIRSCLPT